MQKLQKNKQFNTNKLLLLLVFLGTLLMGIGYASVSSVTLDIEGNLVANVQDGVFITEVNYVSNYEADLNSSEIINCYETMMNSKVVLSTTSPTSSITYRVKVRNNTDTNHYFNRVVYDSSFYSNSNITFKIEGITRGDKLVSGDDTELTITFYYLNNNLPSTTIKDYNVLNSYLNFVFTPENELVDYYLNGSGILLKNSLTTGTIATLGADYINGIQGSNFKIDGDNGLYINDSSTSLNYWVVFYFVDSDGYSSSLDPNYVYYLSAKNKVVTKYSDSSFFRFALSNYLHSNGTYGIAAISSNNRNVTDDYTLLSIWGKPTKSKETVSGTKTYVSDYVDAVQLGSAGSAMSESYTKNLMFLDLSTIFGVGNEPGNKWCDANIAFDTVSVKWFAE